jgi:hypothetical protein
MLGREGWLVLIRVLSSTQIIQKLVTLDPVSKARQMVRLWSKTNERWKNSVQGPRVLCHLEGAAMPGKNRRQSKFRGAETSPPMGALSHKKITIFLAKERSSTIQ